MTPDPFAIIGLAPHAFADPYRAFDDDDHEIECCGVRTPQGSPCGYPRSMHGRGQPLEMSGPPADDSWSLYTSPPETDDSGRVIAYVVGAAAVVLAVLIGALALGWRP